MKKALFTLAVAALVLSSASFAQTVSSDYAATNDDNSSGNTSTLFAYNHTALSVQQTLSTGGQFGLGGGYFANTRLSTSSNGKCLFISNAGSETISAFTRTALAPLTYSPTPTTTPTGGSGSSYGVGLAVTPDHKHLYASLDDLQEIAIFDITTTGGVCGLKASGTASGLGDYVGPLSVSSDGKVLIVTGPNNQFVDAYAINASTGGLTLINQVSLSSVSSCSSTGCYVTGSDISEVKGGKATVVMGNATLSGPYYVECALDTTAGLSSCVNNNVTGTSLANIESPFYNKAGYAGTTGGGIYLGAAGFGSGYPAGVSLNAVNSSGVPAPAAEASYVNSAGYYCSNAQSYTHAPTVQYVWQSCTNSSLDNTMYLYTSNGSNSITNTITPLANPNAQGNTFVLSLLVLPVTR